MAEHAYATQNKPQRYLPGRGIGRSWPVGSELLIAFALGAVGWYGILRLVLWLAG